MRLLLIYRTLAQGEADAHQIYGFKMYRRELRKKLGISVKMVRALRLRDIQSAVETHRADIAVIMVHWSERAEDVVALFRNLGGRPHRPKLVFLDYYAPTCSPHFAVLPYVDRYIKRQVLVDRSIYQQTLEGGFVFTDFLAKEMNYRIGPWFFGSTPDPALMHKVVYGWNFGVSPGSRSMLRLNRLLHRDWSRRVFAINQRIGIAPIHSGADEWYQQYRRFCAERLKSVGRKFPSSAGGRTGRGRYLLELMRSRVVFSPFGWGELCFRDYEAVCCGALLIKPSMAHLQTSPNIFVEGRTYVAVRWDLSDLEDKIRHFLENPSEAQELVGNAMDCLHDYYEHDGFVKDVARTLEGFLRPSRQSED